MSGEIKMDSSKSTESITPLASVNVVHDQAGQADQTKQEATTEGNDNTAVYISGMDLDVFNAAKQGNIGVLREHGDHLEKVLTATKNTVLHIYIACSSSPTFQESEEDELKSVKIVKDILEMCPAAAPALLLQQNESGDTALHIAARHGRFRIVSVLIEVARTHCRDDLEQGRDSSEEACLLWRTLIRKTNKNKDTAMHEAVRFNNLNNLEAVKVLAKEDPEFSYPTNDAGETPLYIAVERGYRFMVFELLGTCKYPTYKGPNGRTALHAAVVLRDEDYAEELTRRLLETDKALAKEADEQGSTPLHLAAGMSGRRGVRGVSIVKILLGYDTSVAYIGRKDDKATALHIAASEGNVDVMKELIFHCPDCCELVDSRFQNALHYALSNNGARVVEYVLKDPWLRNILLNGKDIDGNTPLHLVQPRSAGKSYWKWVCTLIRYDEVDAMAFNKKNFNLYDSIEADLVTYYYELSDDQQSDLDKALHKRGVRPSHRIKSHKDGDNEVKEKERSEVIEEKERSKVIEENEKKAKETHMVVAALIATVTFAAGFTMPGGYYQTEHKGSELAGFVVLSRNAAFKAFVITDTLAMAMSSCSVLVLLYSTVFAMPISHNRFISFGPLSRVVNVTMLSLILMVVAFITGTYAVLAHSSSGLAITATVLGCYFFFILANSLLTNANYFGKKVLTSRFVKDILEGLLFIIFSPVGAAAYSCGCGDAFQLCVNLFIEYTHLFSK